MEVTVAEVSHPVFARVYERLSVAMDRAGTAAYRRDLVAGLSGRVIEIGAGNGRMFPHYPPSVTEVVAVEPERRLRAAAERAASTAPVPVTVVDGLADRLPARAGEFDAAVVALVLCTVPDQASALTEAGRVLRPGGELRFFEHVAAENPGGLHRAQRLVDATLWPKLFAGCHTSRDTVAAITSAGFVIGELRRFRFPATSNSPSSPCVHGRAIWPATAGRR
ncbi:methyltransferase domain-containing protein [Micromonospora chokoriensis]